MISIRYAHPVTRRPVRVQVASDSEAAAVRERVRHYRLELRTGGLTADEVTRRLAVGDPLTLREAAASWKKGTSRTTQYNATALIERGALAPLAGEALDAIDGDRLARWVAGAERSYADSSILWAWRVLSAIVRGAVQRRKLRSVPWGDWRPPRRLDPTPRPREIVTKTADAARLLGAARELDGESRSPLPCLEPRIALLLLVGFRTGELSGLRWSDLDGDRRRVAIVRQYAGERVKARAATIRAPAELFEVLERWRARLELAGLYAPEGPVFPSWLASRRAGHPVHRPGKGIESVEVRPVVVRAGLPNPERWTVHALRASFVCFELASSGSLAHAMARGRHRSVKAVQHYARALLELEPPEPAWSLPPAADASRRLA